MNEDIKSRIARLETEAHYKTLRWLLVVLLVLVGGYAVLAATGRADGWEGDDGGLDSYEVSLGRWAAAVEAQAERGAQMQLTTPPAPPTTVAPRPPHYDSWLRIAECESNGRWDINTGNGYYGGLQFSLSTWRAVGGSGYPHQASMLTQMWMAERVLTAPGGGWGAWPVCGGRR